MKRILSVDNRDWELIGYYVEKFVDDWGCQFDYVDGSTASFSSVALEEVCSKS